MILSYRKQLLILTISLILSLVSDVMHGQCFFPNNTEGEICSTARYICGSELNGYTSSLRDTNYTQFIWPGSNSGVCLNGGQFDNTSWFVFTACSRNVHIRITFNNCVSPMNSLLNTGIQSGLYTACNKNSSVACDEVSNAASGVLDLQYNNFVPGQLVYFVLDGWARSVCQFSIQVISGIDISPVTPPDASLLADGDIIGQNMVSCSQQNTPITYSLVEPERKVSFSTTCTPPSNFNPSDSVCYAWSVFPFTGRNFANQDSTGKTIDLVFTEPGTYTISVTTHFNPYYVGSCANVAAGKINTWTVTVLPPDYVTEPIQYHCPGDFFWYCGQYIDHDTTIICDADPCRIVTQEFRFGTSQLNLMGTQYICAGSSFDFQGVSYTQSGPYEVVDVNNCSLLHRFDIQSININVNILAASSTLNCNQRQITLNGISNTNGTNTLQNTWLDAQGNTISNVSDVNISKGGEYTFTSTYTTPSGTCADLRKILITEDFTQPSISAIIPTVRCLKRSETRPSINISANDPSYIYMWTRPDGSVTSTQNIQVDSINAVTGRPYRLTVTGNNGCLTDTSFIVASNFQRANVLLSGDDLTCFHPIQKLSFTSDIAIDSIRWSKNAPGAEYYGTFGNNVMSYNVSQPGIYKVEVMASASKCWNDGSIDIAQDKVLPDLTLDHELKWHCNTVNINLSPQASVGNRFNYNWTTIDGNIISDDTKNKDITVGSTGSYQVIVLDNVNGCKRSGTVIISNETNVPTEITLNAGDVSCFGQNDGEINILNTIGGFGPYTYYKDDIIISETSLRSLAPGTYTLMVKDVYECPHKVEVIINEPDALQVETVPSIKIDYSENLILRFESNYNFDEIQSVVWYNSKGEILGTELTLDYTGEYDEIISVEVITEKGCTNRSQISIDVDNDLKVFVPNIFSPNGDGVNDLLILKKNKIPASNAKIAIYDRYGNKVLSKNDIDLELEDFTWDGRFNNQELVPGVYVMIMELSDFLGKRHVIKQDITIIR